MTRTPTETMLRAALERIEGYTMVIVPAVRSIGKYQDFVDVRDAMDNARRAIATAKGEDRT